MHIGHRSIKALQTQSMAYRQQPKPRHEPTGYQPALCESNWQPGTCQWIEGTPTKMELRKYGSDRFKCGAPAKLESAYCEDHHKICYKPLTIPDEQAGFDE